MTISTMNPYTMEKIADYEEETEEEIIHKIAKLRESQDYWKKDIDIRIAYFRNELKPRLQRDKNYIAKLMSTEMGKPISQSKAEVEKCINLVDYAIENFRRFLENEIVETEAESSYVRFDPVGTVLLIMPWNFPLWQVMRAAIPAMASGNGVLLKHASIVSGTSLKLEEIFDSPLFRATIVRGPEALSLIRHVDGVSFTGSTEVGSRIAQEAGKEIKRHVLELGGSDPFIVLKSADVEAAAKNASTARLQNNGQSCIASKRFIVHQDIYAEFYRKLREEFSSVVPGDPLEKTTQLGPLSSPAQTRTVMDQIIELKGKGTVEMIGKQDGGYIPPTIAMTKESYSEEIFGPVAVLRKFRTNEEAVKLGNETPYGLGASIWGDRQEAEAMVPDIEAGMVFVNRIVSSDPRLPFGGVRKSGIGRELSRYGLLEFTNIKSVWIQ